MHNANTAFPPPTTLSGRDTGLLSSDALGFTGKTTIAVADSSGNLVSRIDVDFDAGTLSVDGGAGDGFGTTVGSFVDGAQLRAGRQRHGQLCRMASSAIDATGTNGIVVQDDADNAASRGGSGFSQFFGLNDLFRTCFALDPGDRAFRQAMRAALRPAAR